MLEIIVDLVQSISSRVEYLEKVDVELVFDPPWGQDSMSDEAMIREYIRHQEAEDQRIYQLALF